MARGAAARSVVGLESIAPMNLISRRRVPKDDPGQPRPEASGGGSPLALTIGKTRKRVLCDNLEPPRQNALFNRADDLETAVAGSLG